MVATLRGVFYGIACVLESWTFDSRIAACLCGADNWVGGRRDGRLDGWAGFSQIVSTGDVDGVDAVFDRFLRTLPRLRSHHGGIFHLRRMARSHASGLS